jgi:hypothetical protein
LRPVRTGQFTIKIKRHIVTWAALVFQFGTKLF